MPSIILLTVVNTYRKVTVVVAGSPVQILTPHHKRHDIMPFSPVLSNLVISVHIVQLWKYYEIFPVQFPLGFTFCSRYRETLPLSFLWFWYISTYGDTVPLGSLRSSHPSAFRKTVPLSSLRSQHVCIHIIQYIVRLFHLVISDLSMFTCIFWDCLFKFSPISACLHMYIWWNSPIKSFDASLQYISWHCSIMFTIGSCNPYPYRKTAPCLSDFSMSTFRETVPLSSLQSWPV